MFKPETVKKVSDNIRATFDAYMSRENIDDVKICISCGNRKIGKVMNVSLPPLLSCGNCAGCARFCYDVKACLQYPQTVIDARVRNYAILKRDRERYFAEIAGGIATAAGSRAETVILRNGERRFRYAESGQ